MTEFVEKKYVQKNSIEKRDYQINLATQAIKEISSKVRLFFKNS